MPASPASVAQLKGAPIGLDGEIQMSVAYTVLLVAQAVLGLVMILLVLLHAPKGEGMGGIGGTATMFTGRRGAEAGLDRLTWGVFLLFLVLCVLSGFGIVK